MNAGRNVLGRSPHAYRSGKAPPPSGRFRMALVIVLLLPLPSGAADAAFAASDLAEEARIINATRTMTFFVTEVPDSVGGGFEPHILAAPGVDGREWYYVDSPTGLGSQESGWLWVTKDDGQSWSFRSKGVISGSWAGSGDSYTAVGRDGVIYFTDLLLATATIQASRDGGLSWVRNPQASVTPLDDRQWLSMGPTVQGTPLSQSETLYMSYNQIPSGLWIMCSQYTKLGLGWKPGNRGRALTADTNARDLMTVDPHDGTVYLANTGASGLSVFVSTDGARSFRQAPVLDGTPEMFQNIFVVADVDEDGNLYLAWTDQRNVTLAVSRDKGDSWRFLPVTSGNGTRVLPWVAAGDGGRAGVVWYETNATGMSDELADATWDVRAAVCTDVFADNVTFYQSVVMPAVHGGSIRTTGASGNADRDLGDYMSCDVDRMGRLILTFGNDGNDGVGKYNAKVMVARQTGGPFLRKGFGPVARFSHSVSGQTVSVDGKDSYDQNGRGISMFRWDWGDGTNTTDRNGTTATHRYAKAGRYELQLTVSNPDNLTASSAVWVKASGPPAPSILGLLLPIGVAVAAAAGIYVWWRRRQARTGAG